MKKNIFLFFFLLYACKFAYSQTPNIEIYYQQFTATNPISTGTYETVSNVYFANVGSASGPFDIECDLDYTNGNFATVIGKICGLTMTPGYYYGPYTFNSGSNDANQMPSSCGNYQIAFIVSNTSCAPSCGTKAASCLYDVAPNGYTLPYPVTVNGCSSCTAPSGGVITPSAPTVTAPNSANLTVSASGTLPFAYQWYIWNGSTWTALTNSSPYSGTTTQTLAISPTATGMSGNYYTCVVGNPCGAQNNIPSVQLTVNSPSNSVTSSFSSSINCQGQTSYFYDGSYGNPSPNYWYWTFGDGTYSYSQNPTHVYASSGNYNVSLYVQNSSGNNNTSTQQVSVSSSSVTASFNYSAGSSGQATTFSDASSYGCGSASSWSWNFGDGSSSTSQNPSHIYNSSGTFYVTLTAYNSLGNSSSYSQWITINPSAIAITVNGTPSVAPWQRANESYSVTMNVSTSDNSNWRVVAHDVNGNNPDQYSGYQSNGSIINSSFTFSTPTSAIAYYAQSETGGASSNISSQTEIIESKWDNKNAVFYNSATNQLLIPLHYFSNTISTTINFSRVSNSSSYAGNLVNVPTVQFGNQKYFAIDYSNSLIQGTTAGTFNYTINYNPSAFFQESGKIDLTKIGNVNNSNNGNNNIVVLVGGNIDIESSIQALPNSNTSASVLSWSIANNLSVDFGKNTWYISTDNLNPLQKNAYNLGVALEEIRRLCINAGSTLPNISVIAHSKGGLEMRMMLDGQGAPLSSPYDFILNPSNPFTNTAINNSLNAVIFIGTPHGGAEAGYVENPFAPLHYVSGQINDPQIISYFQAGTSVPNNIRIGNVSAYRKCNLSDGSVALNSADNPVLYGASSISKFYVKSIPLDNTNIGPSEVFSTFCDLGGCASFLPFALSPPPLDGIAALAAPCEVACNLNYIGQFVYTMLTPTIWNDAFHHIYLTSSYVLENASVTCLDDNTNTAYGALDKIVSVMGNAPYGDCVSPLTQNCPPVWIQLISSVLQNATISKKGLSDSAFIQIGISDENGIVLLPTDMALSTGDSIKIEGPGVIPLFIVFDSSLLSYGKLKIPFFKETNSTLQIKHPSLTLENHTPVTNDSSIQIEVTAENVVSYEIFKPTDSTFVPLILNGNKYTLQLMPGRSIITVKFIGAVDSIYRSKEIWYLPDTLQTEFSYPIIFTSNDSTFGTKIYVENDNNLFIKEINLPFDSTLLLKQQNVLSLIRYGYKDTSILINSSTNIDLGTILSPISYSSTTDSSVISFSVGHQTNYWRTISFYDSAADNVISVKQYNDNFSGLGLAPKCRKFEVRHLNLGNSTIRFVVALDQIENLSPDSIYLLKIMDDTGFTKIPFDTSAAIAGYDSLVQKLTYNFIDFNNGTTTKEALAIMKRQPPILNALPALNVNENDSLVIPLALFFSDPDSIGHDISYQLIGSAPHINVYIAGDSLVIRPVLCWNGTDSFTLQAQHDFLTKSNLVSVIVVPTSPPIITATGPTIFCPNKSVTLSVSNGMGYLWSNSQTDSTIVVNTPGIYTVSVIDNYNCVNASLPITITVLPLPNATITTNGSTALCMGDSLSLSVTSATTYLWSNNVTGQAITVSTPGSYSVTVTDINSCSAASLPVSVSVNALPSVIATATDTAICQGETVVLHGNGALTYSWNNNAQDGVPVAPQSSVRYTVTGTDANNCSNSASIVIYVFNLPNVSAHASVTTVCSGLPVTLYGDNASTYLWSDSVQNGIPFIPISTTTYIVTGTDGNGCSDTSVFTISVMQNPNPQINAGGMTTFCEGDSVNLSSSLAKTYLWNNGDTTQNTIVKTTGSYLLTVTDSNNCVGSSVPIMVTVYPLPNPIINSNGATTFCMGDSLSLSVTSATTYLWSNNATGQAITVSTPGSYSVTVTDINSCSAASLPVSVSVNALPSVIATATDTAICQGETVVLHGNGALTYSWNNNAQDGVPVAPQSSVRYTVTGTDANNCSNSASIVIYVFNLPNVSAHASVTTVCSGLPVTLYGDNTSTYLWSDSVQNGIPFIPISTTTYMVTGTDGNGCSDTSVLTISVMQNPNPQINAGGMTTFCEGDSVNLSSSLAKTYLWNNGDTTQNTIVKTTGSYLLTVTDSNNCVGSSVPIMVTVYPLPNPIINSNGATTFCMGDSLSLSVTSATTYLWSNNSTEQSITVSTGGSYSVTMTDVNGCSGTASPVMVTVNPLPIVSLDTFGTIFNITPPFILTGGSPTGGIYSGAGVLNGNFYPSVAGVGTHNIIYTYTDSFGCSDSSISTIIVKEFLGIEDVSRDITVEVYPNPNDGKFIVLIKSPENQALEIFLYNTVGQIVYHKNYTLQKESLVESFDFSTYAKGVYLVGIYAGETFAYVKLIIE